MRPWYEQGKTGHGPGVTKRLKELLHKHLTENRPFAQADDRLSSTVQQELTSFVNDLQVDVNAILEDISSSFEGILLHQAETPTEAKARAELKSLLAGSMPTIERLKDDLALIKQRYPKVED